MDKEIIEQLKKNEKPLTLMLSDLLGMGFSQVEIYDAIEEIGENFQKFGNGMIPGGWDEDQLYIIRPDYTAPAYVFRLRPDYMEQPAIIECKMDGYYYVEESANGQKQHQVLSTAISDLNLVGFKSDGWLFGRLYKNKNNGLIESRIKAKSIDQYDVLPIDAVLFSK